MNDQQDSYDLFRFILEHSVDISYQRDLQTNRFDYINPAGCEFLGITSAEAALLTIDQIIHLVHPEDISRTQEIVSQHIDAKEHKNSGTVEYKFLHSDGDYRWFSESFRIVFNADGSPSKLLGNIRDITEPKKLQLAIEESETKYKQLFANARVALFRASSDGQRLLECNDRLAKMVGYETREDCLAKCVPVRVIVNSQWAQRIAELKTKLETGMGQIHICRTDSIVIPARWSARYYPQQDYVEGALFNETAAELLSKSEKAVLRGLIAGLTNKEIAVKLHRSVRTVEDQRSSIMHKLGARNSVELAKRAIDLDCE